MPLDDGGMPAVVRCCGAGSGFIVMLLEITFLMVVAVVVVFGIRKKTSKCS